MPRFVICTAFAIGVFAGVGVTLLLTTNQEPASSATTPPTDTPPSVAPTVLPPPEVRRPAPQLAVAPPPRDAEHTRCFRSYFQESSLPTGKTSATEVLGVQWRVGVGVRRLVSTGRDIIEFHWEVKYVGRRPPLIMLRPSFTDSRPGATQADFYAFPPGEQKGRWVTLPDPDNPPGRRLGIFELPDPGWFLEANGGKWEPGTETIAVADLKEVLRSQFPGEFPADAPPKLYTRFRHRAMVRLMDAWTGELESEFLEIPDLKTW